MNRFEQKRVERMWRNKDIEGIKDHTARVTGDSEKFDVEPTPKNVIEIFRGTK